MKNSKINQKIIDLWAKYFKPTSDVKVPMFYDTPKKGGILFIGMNPAYNQREVDKLVKESSIFSMKEMKELYNYSSFIKNKDKSQRVDFLIDREEYWIEKYPFFKQMKKIASDNKTFFQHLDLFFFKETKQNELLKKIIEKETKDYITFNDFGKDQLKLFKEIINQHAPKLIVVANAKASQIFKQEFADSLEWNEKRGYHLFKNNTPIFFSGMLSGQRALDVHSRERFEWQIRQIVNPLH